MHSQFWEEYQGVELYPNVLRLSYSTLFEHDQLIDTSTQSYNSFHFNHDGSTAVDYVIITSPLQNKPVLSKGVKSYCLWKHGERV